MTTPGGAARVTGGQANDPSDGHPACDLYLPGHLVHFIQAERASGSEDPVRWGRFAGLEDGRLVVRSLDATRRYRIHRPGEVARVAEAGDKVRVSERWRVATVTRRFEHVISVCIALPDDPWRPCGVAPAQPESLGDLAGVLEERGGFVVPVAVRRASPTPDSTTPLPKKWRRPARPEHQSSPRPERS